MTEISTAQMIKNIQDAEARRLARKAQEKAAAKAKAKKTAAGV